MVYEIVVVTLLLPAGVSAAAVFLELLASGKGPADERADRPAWLAGGVAAAGSLLAAYSLLDWTKLVPDDYWHWLPHAVVAVTAMALLAAMSQRGWACAIVLVATLAFAGLMTPAWDHVASIRAWVAAGLAVTMLVFLSLALPLRREHNAHRQWLIGIVLALHLIAAAVIAAHSGWAKLAQLTLPLVVALAMLSVAVWLYPRRQFLYGAVPAFAVAFPAVLLLAWYYTFSLTMSAWAFALPALGPLVLLAVLAVTQRSSNVAQIAAICAAIIFPVAGVAVALATA